MALLTGLALAGCSSDYSLIGYTDSDRAGCRQYTNCSSRGKASQSLNTIAGIEQQRSPAVSYVEDYPTAPPSMTQAITVKWTGPIEQITETLASRAGLRFRSKGNPPPIPITVMVDVYKQPLVEVLRDIGLQAGHRADLTVDGQSGFVEIRYAPVDKL